MERPRNSRPRFRRAEDSSNEDKLEGPGGRCVLPVRSDFHSEELIEAEWKAGKDHWQVQEGVHRGYVSFMGSPSDRVETKDSAE